MKAHVLEAVNRISCKEVPTPVLHPGEVLVEVMAAGICGSDIPRVFQTGTYHFPTIPGHEFSGRVADVYHGAESAEHQELSCWIGKRVGVFPLIPCRECEPCRKKQYEMCRHYNYLGSRCDGGFAEYVAVPVWNLIPLPGEVSFEEAAMLEPASVALHAVRRLELSGAESVALFGLGTIGILIAEWLSVMGVPKVYATGHSEQHGALMKSVTGGAYEYLKVGRGACDGQQSGDAPAGTDGQLSETAEWILQQTGGSGADAVIDCVATSSSLSDALLSVRAGGQILEVGNPKGDMVLPKDVYWKLLRKQIRLTGTWNSTFTQEDMDDWHTTVDCCADGRLKLKELITHRLPFEELEKGLYLMRDRTEYHNKVMIVKD
jgi:L-iditol 2-dehydrogenase